MIKIGTGERIRTLTPIALVGSAYQSGYSLEYLDGAIEKIVLTTTTLGSYYLATVQISGTKEVIWNTGANSSGATPQVYIPRVLVTDSGGTQYLGSGFNTFDKFVTHEKLFVAGSAISTAGSLIFKIYYR